MLKLPEVHVFPFYDGTIVAEPALMLDGRPGVGAGTGGLSAMADWSSRSSSAVRRINAGTIIP